MLGINKKNHFTVIYSGLKVLTSTIMISSCQYVNDTLSVKPEECNKHLNESLRSQGYYIIDGQYKEEVPPCCMCRKRFKPEGMDESEPKNQPHQTIFGLKNINLKDTDKTCSCFCDLDCLEEFIDNYDESYKFIEEESHEYRCRMGCGEKVICVNYNTAKYYLESKKFIEENIELLDLLPDYLLHLMFPKVDLSEVNIKNLDVYSSNLSQSGSEFLHTLQIIFNDINKEENHKEFKKDLFRKIFSKGDEDMFVALFFKRFSVENNERVPLWLFFSSLCEIYMADEDLYESIVNNNNGKTDLFMNPESICAIAQIIDYAKTASTLDKEFEFDKFIKELKLFDFVEIEEAKTQNTYTQALANLEIGEGSKRSPLPESKNLCDKEEQEIKLPIAYSFGSITPSIHIEFDNVARIVNKAFRAKFKCVYQNETDIIRSFKFYFEEFKNILSRKEYLDKTKKCLAERYRSFQNAVSCEDDQERQVELNKAINSLKELTKKSVDKQSKASTQSTAASEGSGGVSELDLKFEFYKLMAGNLYDIQEYELAKFCCHQALGLEFVLCKNNLNKGKDADLRKLKADAMYESGDYDLAIEMYDYIIAPCNNLRSDINAIKNKIGLSYLYKAMGSYWLENDILAKAINNLTEILPKEGEEETLKHVSYRYNHAKAMAVKGDVIEMIHSLTEARGILNFEIQENGQRKDLANYIDELDLIIKDVEETLKQNDPRSSSLVINRLLKLDFDKIIGS
jgi:hypothetical protein